MGNSFISQIESYNLKIGAKGQDSKNIDPTTSRYCQSVKFNQKYAHKDHPFQASAFSNPSSFKCQCFKSDKHVKSVKVKRDIIQTWKWTNNHSLSLLTSDTISDLDDIFPIDIMDIIINFIKNDTHCKYRHGKIFQEFYYSDIRFLIHKKSLCNQWYKHKYDPISQLLSLNITFIGKGHQIAEDLIQGLCDSTLPELRPSYLNENETRRTLNINGYDIRLDIKNQTCVNSEISMNNDHESELMIITLEFGNSEELYQIQQYLDNHVQIKGTVKNCIILSKRCSSLYKRYNDDHQSLPISHLHKVELFCKHWNVPYINIDNAKGSFSFSNTPFSFFIYCAKYSWFCDAM